MPEMVLGYVAAPDAALLPLPTASIGSRFAVALAPNDVTKVGFHMRVAACCRRAAFLPARMGLRADDGMLSYWAAREQSLQTAFSALGRRVELAITVMLAAAVHVEGRGYLAALKQEQDVLDGVAAGLRSIARSHDAVSCFQSIRRGLEGSILTTRADATDIVLDLKLMDEMAEERLVIAVSGPWPPYRFAAAHLADVT